MRTDQSVRLDVLLVARGLADTPGRAGALIAAGLIEVDGTRAARSDQAVASGVSVRLVGAADHPWVSRGGLKLDAALTAFAVDAGGRVCLDAGASSGGFTDVLLSRGAARVYAVDVGRGQLDTRLTRDPRVVVLDRTNLRTLEALPGPDPSLVTLDLSFISLRAVLPRVSALAPGAEVVALFKPQFEVTREHVDAGGIVRDEGCAAAALADFTRWAVDELGAALAGAPLAAPVRGAKGNQEWLVHLRLALTG